MTVATHFWDEPAFLELIPYITATAAWDKRNGNSPRFDLRSSAPAAVVVKALAFEGRCVACGRLMHPLRSRAAEQKRGKGKENVYLAVCCLSSVSPGCNKGKKASEAYQTLWALWRGLQGQQEELFTNEDAASAGDGTSANRR